MRCSDWARLEKRDKLLSESALSLKFCLGIPRQGRRRMVKKLTRSCLVQEFRFNGSLDKVEKILVKDGKMILAMV